MKAEHVTEAGNSCDVLVTGAAGVLGRRIVHVLRDSGVDVVATGRSLSSDIDTVWDLASASAPDSDVRPGVVVHAAARMAGLGALLTPGGDLFDVNVSGTARVVAWSLANDVKKLVLISGALVFGGWQTQPASESDATNAIVGGAYGVSKLCAESVAELMTSAGRQLSVLRLSGLYGAGYDRGLPQRFIRDGMNTGEIHLTPPVDTAFDLLHIDDAAATVAKTVTHGTGGLWNVGSGSPTKLLVLAEACASSSEAQVIVETGGFEAETGVMNWVNDSKARRELGHRNTVDLESGIEMIARSMCSQ